MFVDPSQGRALCLQILHGQPTGRLLWYTTEWCISDLAKQAGYADGIDFMIRDLGCAAFENLDYPFRLHVPQVQIVETHEGDALIREHRSPWGTLREVRREGNRVVEHPVADEQSLTTLADMWEHLQVEVRPEVIDRLKKRVAGRGAVGCCTPTSSLQQMIQHELGIVNFWYAVADTPALVERAMAGYQAAIQTDSTWTTSTRVKTPPRPPSRRTFMASTAWPRSASTARRPGRRENPPSCTCAACCATCCRSFPPRAFPASTA
jgi:hypothetical protein